jgi:Ca2+-binding RTX toxin-like protein
LENIIGGIRNDILRGNSGKNYLNGGPGDDRLFGGSGDDILDAGSGVSYDEGLFGEDGNDVLIVSEFFDGTYSGGEGTDILVLEGSESDYTFTKLNWLETEITSLSHFGKITVMGIEEFQYGKYSPLQLLQHLKRDRLKNNRLFDEVVLQSIESSYRWLHRRRRSLLRCQPEWNPRRR